MPAAVVAGQPRPRRAVRGNSWYTVGERLGHGVSKVFGVGREHKQFRCPKGVLFFVAKLWSYEPHAPKTQYAGELAQGLHITPFSGTGDHEFPVRYLRLDFAPSM